MASDPAEADELLKSIEYDELLKKYTVLEESHKKVVNNETLMKRQLDENVSELDKLRSEVQILQGEVKDRENKLSATEENERKLMSTVSELRMSLLSSQGERQEYHSQLCELNVKVAQLTVEKENQQNENATNKLRINDLENRLRAVLREEESKQRQLTDSETEKILLRESTRHTINKLREENAALEKERDELRSSNQQLRLDLSRAHTEVDLAKGDADVYRNRAEKFELNHKSAKRANDELVNIYERQRKDMEKQVDQAKADVLAAQRDAEAKNQQLVEENKKLVEQAGNLRDRYEIARSRLEKLTKEPVSPAPETDTPRDLSPQSNLLRLIQQYEADGKQWEDVYQEFFDLREAHARLIAQNANLSQSTDRLLRERRDKEMYYGRVNFEYGRLRDDANALEAQVKQLQENFAEKSAQAKEFEASTADLRKKNDELAASLQDTTYQLRYLIRDVQSRQERLPPGVESSDDLLTFAMSSPTLDHDKVVFKNLDELQQRNQELLTEVRNLTATVEEKTRTIEGYTAQHARTEESYEKTIGDAKATIDEMNDKIEMLQYKLSTIEKERDLYMKVANSKDSGQPAPAVSDSELQDAIAQYKRLAQESEASFDAYRIEAEKDSQQLQQQLQEAQSITARANADLRKCEAELHHLREKTTILSRTAELRHNEIMELRRVNHELQGQMGRYEQNARESAQELFSYKRTVEEARLENVHLSAQAKSYEESYKRVLDENKYLATERSQLSQLLEDVNKNLAKSNANSEHLVSELRERVKEQRVEVEDLRDKLTAAQKDLQESQSVDQRQWQNKYVETRGELLQLKALQASIEKDLAVAREQRTVLETKLATAEKEAEARKSVSGEAGTIANVQEDVTLELARARNDAEDLRAQVRDYEADLQKVKQASADAAETHRKFVSDMEGHMQQVVNDLMSRETRLKEMEKETQEAAETAKRMSDEKQAIEERWAAEKSTLVSEKTSLEERIATQDEELTRLRSEIERQTTIAKETQEKLDEELQSHSKDSDALRELREQLERITTELANAKAECENAQGRLKAAETSWEKQKEQSESAENDLKQRLDESRNQQDTLSRQFQELFEKLSEKNAPTAEEDVSEKSSQAVASLREVTASLRRENDVLHTKHGEAVERCKRAEAEVEYVNQRLQHLRTQVDQYRVDHDALVKKYEDAGKTAANETAAYRDSNTKLRDEVNASHARLQELETQLRAKEAEMEPLKAQIHTLEGEIKVKQDAVALLEKTQKDWEIRTADIMSRHNKLDPKELENLKSELEQTKTKLVEAENATKESQGKLDAALKAARDRLQLAHLYKKRFEEVNKKYEEEEKNKSSKAADDTQTKAELAKLEEKFKAAEEAKAKAEAEVQKKTTEVTEQQDKFSKLLARARALVKENNALKKAAEAKGGESSGDVSQLNTQIEELRREVAQKEDELQRKRLDADRQKILYSMEKTKNTKLNAQIKAFEERLQKLQPGAAPVSVGSPALPSSPALPASPAPASPAPGSPAPAQSNVASPAPTPSTSTVTPSTKPAPSPAPPASAAAAPSIPAAEAAATTETAEPTATEKPAAPAATATPATTTAVAAESPAAEKPAMPEKPATPEKTDATAAETTTSTSEQPAAETSIETAPATPASTEAAKKDEEEEGEHKEETTDPSSPQKRPSEDPAEPDVPAKRTRASTRRVNQQ